MAFGLSMDYELFLLSRVEEEWDRTGDNTAAVAVGLRRAGAIITNAALLLDVVIGAFTSSDVAFIKLIGVGLLAAVVVDATLVRALLVPATIRLLDRADWRLPRPLRRLHARVALGEAGQGIARGPDIRPPAVPPAMGTCKDFSKQTLRAGWRPNGAIRT